MALILRCLVAILLLSTVSLFGCGKSEPTVADLRRLLNRVFPRERGDPADAEAAARELESYGNRAIPGLAEIVRSDPTWSNRSAAAFCLDVRNNEIAFQALIGALRDKVLPVREAAASSLGKIGDKRAVEPLISAITDSEYVLTIYQALGQLHDNRAVPALLKALSKEEPIGKEYAADALGEIGDKSVVTVLEKYATHVDIRIAASATGALARLDPGNDVARRVVPRLIVHIQLSDDVFTRVPAIQALGHIGDKRAIPALIQATRDSSYPVRRDAATALGQLRAMQAENVLRGLLKDPNMQVREAARKALAALAQ